MWVYIYTYICKGALGALGRIYMYITIRKAPRLTSVGMSRRNFGAVARVLPAVLYKNGVQP